MTRSFSGLAALVGLLLFSPSWVWAEHTPEHRFTISGYVYDDAGKPLTGAVVARDAAGTILATTDTGGSGYYAIRLHLHDSNLGDRLFVQSAAGKKELIVHFDPRDKTTERGAEVNFGKVPQSPGLMGNSALLYVGAFILAAGTLYTITKRRKSRFQPSAKKKQRKS